MLMPWPQKSIAPKDRHLKLVPCQHFWLEVKSGGGKIIAICKWPKCRQRGEFTMEEWNALALDGRALNKPVRV